MEVRTGAALVINAPEFFSDEAFVEWLNAQENIMTWHCRGEAPNEWSDTVVLVDPGLEEGSNSDMPEAIWKQITSACREAGLTNEFEHITVRLTNV